MGNSFVAGVVMMRKFLIWIRRSLDLVTIFMIEVVGMLGYFNCFPDYVGLVAAGVGYDFHFVKVGAMCGCRRVFGYHCSLVLRCGVSDIAVEM
jgi:hypothetical protein